MTLKCSILCVKKGKVLLVDEILDLYYIKKEKEVYMKIKSKRLKGYMKSLT
jgi:hypothetical protein